MYPKKDTRIQEPTLKPLTNYEKISIFFSYRSTTIVLSILTLGFYYLYYHFCLEQHTPNPFNTRKKYGEYVIEEHEIPSVIEDQRFSNRYIALLEGKEYRFSSRKLRTWIEHFWIQKKVKIVSFFSGFISAIERLMVSFNFFALSRERIQERDEDWEKRIKGLLKKKLDLIPEDEFNNLDFEDNIKRSIGDNPETLIPKRKYDYFILFIFGFSYVLFSLITLGIFPLYHYWNQEKESFKLSSLNYQSEFMDTNEFQERVEQLKNETDFDYSAKLISAVNFDSKSNAFTDLYKTRLFKNYERKKLTIWLLNFFTGGIFGIWLLTKNAFKKTPVSKDLDDLILYFKNRKTNKVYLIRDLTWDIKLASCLAAVREEKMQRDIKKLLKVSGTGLYPFFLRTISSDWFKWAFSFLAFFIILSVECLLGVFASGTVIFWLWTIFALSFLSLFTYHVNLLFF
ncbi:hypothetical protein A6V39_04600 [Candidatus Mycoplasma haematobovis]|uniref:Uncharacterized protein n=1 Tax=Candidatus Mycoplasma haematobovis TaxID=432608 RepID=A0A1A9QDJ7_9MOLU|nr:phosphate ABC transporter permease [Candidatus Mycoplasma haematobovis]OAL10164.1 hypothetical protein A6V39_04600 [Candidatus Mycoplasma haematobovis]